MTESKASSSNILTALIRAKSGFKPILKSETNPFFKSKYASLDSILAAIEPALLANKLFLSHSVQGQEMITTLWHESGEFIQCSCPIPSPERGGRSTEVQQIGAAITYTRRYSICMLLSLSAEEDTDGNTNLQQTQQPNGPRKTNGAKTISREEFYNRKALNEIEKDLKEIESKHDVIDGEYDIY